MFIMYFQTTSSLSIVKSINYLVKNTTNLLDGHTLKMLKYVSHSKILNILSNSEICIFIGRKKV